MKSDEKILTMEEAKYLFEETRETFYLEVDEIGQTASLFDSDDLYVTKERWLEIRGQIDDFYAYIESPEYVSQMSIQEINRVRLVIAYESGLKKIGL